MKYFLAIDKGTFQNGDNRYVKLAIKDINEKLDKDNNLKAICVFTMGFNNQKELKTFLVSNGLIPKNYINCDLKIIYKRNNFRSLNIPYLKDAQYFDIGTLATIITKKVSNPNFSKTFIDYFKNNKYLPEQYYILKSALINNSEEYILFDKVMAFLNSYCYSENGFSYRSLYDIAMLISNFDNLKNDDMSMDKNKTTQVQNKANLTEEQLFKLEEWLDNDDKAEIDGQINMFRM